MNADIYNSTSCGCGANLTKVLDAIWQSDREYPICSACGQDPTDHNSDCLLKVKRHIYGMDDDDSPCPDCGTECGEHDDHCEVYLEKMRERAEHMADLREDR